MPIEKADILKVLNHPLVRKIHFCVGPITVNASEYGNVAEYIDAGDIKVIPGRGNVAFYDGINNTIETQAGNPPLDYTDEAQLLHECTHAIVDINELDVLRLNDEVAAYLAQLTFMHLSRPRPLPQTAAGAGPMGRLVFAFLQIIHKYSLFDAKGFGARVSELDIWKLSLAVRAFPEYANVRLTAKSAGGGVPVRNNQMRQLKAAMKRGQRGRQRLRDYSQSPRLMIF